MRHDPGTGRRYPRHRRATASRSHWFLVGLVLLVFALGLLVEGYTHGVLGENSSGVAQAQAGGPGAPGLVLHGGPVINATGARPLTYRMPRRTVALTFDDGPDPVWTPRILAILRRYYVPATFFVVGVHAASYPGLVRQELAGGAEIGSHTYTHLDLAGGWQEQLQLTLAQNALAGAAGVHTGLLRPPYSSTPDAMTAPQWHAYRQAGADGYLIVLASLDTRDWARPGVAKIVAAAMPAANRGAIIMMHDSGGNRSETVSALPQIIIRLKARGYRFTTVTGALGLPDADVPASTGQRVAGLALVITQQAADHAVTVLAIMLVAATVLTVTRALLLVVFARAHRRRLTRPRRSMPVLRYPPGVSVVIPAYNEEAGIAATVTSMLASAYDGDLEVIVVDDGSTDATAAIVAQLGLPGVRLIRQPNGGKPAALNHGIAVARHGILVLVDGDTVFQPDTLARLVHRLADPAIGAVSGNTKVGNRSGMLGRWQHLEYVMGFNLDRRMYDMIRTMPTIPGAIGAFRRGALAAAGGLSGDTLAEDTDLTMAICRTGWGVTYEETAIAWTEAPASLSQLWRQRYRWCYGTMQSMWKHRRAIVERGASGRLGRRCLTYLALFHVLLPLFAPMVDVALIYSLVFLNPLRTLEFWAGFACLQALICAYALRLDRERLTPLWALPLQQVVYRQLMYLVTVQSLITALLGSHQRWQPIRRVGAFADNGQAGDSAGHSAAAEITTARLPSAPTRLCNLASGSSSS
jgi:cellulose synthase/poly-beta-1,6-N-acetylglucosamine synthase-like glycosyltransferase/peptidoglycan/xylan/chitin deacetylase (PgdA/CDA1 family)